MRESKLETSFAAAIREAGGKIYKIPATQTSGMPDRMVLFGGRVYLVELKAERGVVSPRQRIVHTEMADAGVVVYIVRPSNAASMFEFITGRPAPQTLTTCSTRPTPTKKPPKSTY